MGTNTIVNHQMVCPGAHPYQNHNEVTRIRIITPPVSCRVIRVVVVGGGRKRGAEYNIRDTAPSVKGPSRHTVVVVVATFRGHRVVTPAWPSSSSLLSAVMATSPALRLHCNRGRCRLYSSASAVVVSFCQLGRRRRRCRGSSSR